MSNGPDAIFKDKGTGQTYEVRTDVLEMTIGAFLDLYVQSTPSLLTLRSPPVSDPTAEGLKLMIDTEQSEYWVREE